MAQLKTSTALRHLLAEDIYCPVGSHHLGCQRLLSSKANTAINTKWRCPRIHCWVELMLHYVGSS